MRRRDNFFQRLISHTRKFIVFFLKTNTAHGLRYLVVYGLHAVERIVWICCIAVGILGMFTLAQRILYRYQTSPMVVSMDRNMYFWNTSFPSLTLCPHIRINDAKVDQYIQLHPERFTTNEDAVDFKEFVVKLANSTYDTFLELPMNKTFGIVSDDYLDLISNLSWPLVYTSSSGTIVPLQLQPTVTEMGICVAVNSRMAIYSSCEYWKNERWDLQPSPPLTVVHPLDGDVYSQLNELKSSYDVYFHGYMEVPEISKKRYSFYEAFYTTVELSALEIFTSPNAKELWISQRQCRFTDEGDILEFSPVYSYNLCRIECRMRHADKLCGCIPHFYRNIGKRNKKYRICKFSGYRCLGQNAEELITMNDEKRKPVDCNCVPNCDDSHYFVRSFKSRKWFLGANLQWGLLDYPKMQLKRDIIFGLSDVLVYIGGLGGFFLGCSMITFTEIGFFLTWRFFQRQN